jgi:[NiFe] hydrogenase diaphorase moiety large subunit
MAESSTLAQTIRDIVQRHQKLPTRLLQILREVQDQSDLVVRLRRSMRWPRNSASHRTRCAASRVLLLPLHRAARFLRHPVQRQHHRPDAGQPRTAALLCASGLGVGDQRAPAPMVVVSVGTTSCTGMCDQGPAALVNGYALTRLDQTSAGSDRRIGQWPKPAGAVAARVF